MVTVSFTHLVKMPVGVLGAEILPSTRDPLRKKAVEWWEIAELLTLQPPSEALALPSGESFPWLPVVANSIFTVRGFAELELFLRRKMESSGAGLAELRTIDPQARRCFAVREMISMASLDLLVA